MPGATDVDFDVDVNERHFAPEDCSRMCDRRRCWWDGLGDGRYSRLCTRVSMTVHSLDWISFESGKGLTSCGARVGREYIVKGVLV